MLIYIFFLKKIPGFLNFILFLEQNNDKRRSEEFRKTLTGTFISTTYLSTVVCIAGNEENNSEKIFLIC